QLEAFQRIAQYESFQTAATYLNLSQPAVSVRIRELERAVGKSLIQRRTRKLQLTPAGALLLKQANLILQLTRQITGDDSDPLAARIRIGAPGSFAHVC